MKDLKDHKCGNQKLCILGQRKKIYAVEGQAKGNKTNYRLLNNSLLQINQFNIDNCVLNLLGEDSKCDYLFEIKKAGNISDGYFVEMKGDDINYACKQIVSSINLLRKNISGNIFARIVQTKNTTPRFNQQKYYLELKTLLGNRFKYQNKKIEDTV